MTTGKSERERCALSHLPSPEYHLVMDPQEQGGSDEYDSQEMQLRCLMQE